MPHPTHRQLFAVGLGHPGDSARPPGEDMHPLARCSVGWPWGALVLVSGPASFALVQRGGVGLWSALMSTGRATASLAGHPGDLPARGRGRPLRPEAMRGWTKPKRRRRRVS